MAKYGGEQIAKKKAPLGALSESNFARETSDYEPVHDAAALCGYTPMPYPTAGPAADNTVIKNTVPSRGSLGNDGTSRNSYHIQPDLVDSDDAEEGDEGTGIPHEKGRGSIQAGEGHKG